MHLVNFRDFLSVSELPSRFWKGCGHYRRCVAAGTHRTTLNMSLEPKVPVISKGLEAQTFLNTASIYTCAHRYSWSSRTGVHRTVTK